MSPMTSALISYWHRLPAESPVARRRTLDSIRDRVRAGLEARGSLVPFALADVDDGIVAAATHAFAVAPDGAADAGAAAEAIEWVRRGLALNRGAVFGALLALECDGVTAQLSGLRLVLSAAEITAARAVLGPHPGPRALGFLEDWAELVAAAPMQREHLTLLEIVAAGHRAQAA